MPDSTAAPGLDPQQFAMAVDATRQALIEQADPNHVRLLVDLLEDTFVPFSRASIICAMSSLIARYDLTCPQRGVVADSVRDMINEHARVLRLFDQPARGTA